MNSRSVTQGPVYRRTLGAFYNADYRMLWGANLTTYVSRWMSITTLSWFVLIQTDSAFSVSMVAFFALLPHLLLGLFGGLLADNVNKKHLVIATQLTNFAGAAIMSLLLILGTVEYWYAYFAVLVPGFSWALDMPSRRAIILELMGPTGLTNGIALDSVGMHASRMIGPALGGAMIALAGVAGAYVLLSVVIAVGCFLILRVSYSTALPKESGPGNVRVKSVATSFIRVLDNVKEGFAYVYSNSIIMCVVVITVFMNLLLFPYMQMVTVISKNVLSVGPLLMGILMASEGLGALFGSFTIASRASMSYHGRVFLYGSIVSLVALFLFALSQWYLLSLILLMALGVGAAGFGTMQSTIVLIAADPKIRGRTLGVVTLAIGTSPLGALFVGIMADIFTPSTALIINALLGLTAVTLTGFFFPSIRERILSSPRI